jgi:pimeloyl-ACP methyl ester carboxylesterase
MGHVHIERRGDGPRVLFVHGSVVGGAATWGAQYPLASRWTLLVLDRRGFGESSATDREDFEVDAHDIAEALGDGVHLVAHSYGGVGALLAAAMRPHAVRSLTLVEPVVYSIALDQAAVRSCVEQVAAYFAGTPSGPRGFLEGFLRLMGAPGKLPDPLPPTVEATTKLLMHCRFPWTAQIPLDELARAPFRSLAISGGHSPVFESICDVLRDRLGAERIVVPGAGHNVPRAGTAFNERLESFLEAAESRVT